MSDQILIRPLTAQDHDAWRRLWTDYLNFYETTVSEEVYETSFARLLSGDAGEYKGLVAVVDGRIVGLAHYLFHRFMWTVEDTCYLMDLFTAPELRGKGVARALINAVHVSAKASGIKMTYWNTQDNNYKGRMLYDQVAVKVPFVTYEKTD
ncbi:GNAT family N-acetyltransferase [Pseudorhodobacter wandonensis]|uniref:GNAT family N-acetyltransferase n=1 Tax=Pseudorhodobacter wandonensis TaxID=1120568 RepID=UPI00067AC781|nr:GNAT family N-acetyltransferase [Pseudorhodobacter wandonensis]